MPQVDYAALAAQARKPAQSTGGSVDYAALAKQARAVPSQQQEPKPSSAVGDFLGEATQGINPVNLAHMVKSIVMDLPGTVKQIGVAQGELYEKSKAAFARGDTTEGVRHGINWLIPLIGPRIDQAGDYMQQGEYAKGLGATADIGIQAAIPAVAGKVKANIRPVVKPKTNPLEASAVRFAEAEGIPLDVGTKTGSSFAKDAQKRLSSTIGGEAPLERIQAAQEAGLTRVGGDLVRDAGPRPASPVTAGEGVTAALGKLQAQHGATATTAYDALRAAEQAQAATIAQTGGIRGPATSAKPFTATPFAVDLAASKAQLAPIYAEQMRASKIAPPMGAEARALVALDRLMAGPDMAPLSVVDTALSDLKSLLRSSPDGRGRAVVTQVVKDLDARVRAAAAQAGPDVLQALENGRAATRAKYGVQEAADLLSDAGPVQVYKQLTKTKDLGLEKIRAVQRYAPKELPNVARAYLEDAMDLATQEGGFAHADRLWSDWQKMGGETKQALFPAKGQVQALDDFFLLAKKLKENRNTSGTANVAGSLNLAQVGLYLPAKVLALMLTTPAGVRALTTGLKLSVSTTPAARALGVAQIGRAAKAAGVPVEMMVPAMAETEP